VVEKRKIVEPCNDCLVPIEVISLVVVAFAVFG
jgi:hypothetical protein